MASDLYSAPPKMLRGKKSYSQSFQDVWAYETCKGADLSYLEVGARSPRALNNTYILEREDTFRGISIEIRPHWEKEWNVLRQNPLYIADALKFDYPRGEHFSYVSLDMEPAENTFAALKRIVEHDITFDALTFEHDAFRGGGYDEIVKEYLLELGYFVAVDGVTHERLGKDEYYETWFVNKECEPVDYADWLKL